MLIIKDDADVRTVYVQVLKSEGYEVLESANAEDGCEKIKKSDWDVMLLDMDSPDIGEKVLADSQNCEILRTRPFVLLVAEGKDGVLEMNEGLEPSGYIDSLNGSPGEVVALVNRIFGH